MATERRQSLDHRLPCCYTSAFSGKQPTSHGRVTVATAEERFRKLVDDNLEIDGRPLGRHLDLNSSLRDSGVSSVDFVAFAKLVAEEFNVTFSLEDCAKYNTVGELIEFLGTQPG